MNVCAVVSRGIYGWPNPWSCSVPEVYDPHTKTTLQNVSPTAMTVELHEDVRRLSGPPFFHYEHRKTIAIMERELWPV